METVIHSHTKRKVTALPRLCGKPFTHLPPLQITVMVTVPPQAPPRTVIQSSEPRTGTKFDVTVPPGAQAGTTIQAQIQVPRAPVQVQTMPPVQVLNENTPTVTVVKASLPQSPQQPVVQVLAPQPPRAAPDVQMRAATEVTAVEMSNLGSSMNARAFGGVNVMKTVAPVDDADYPGE